MMPTNIQERAVADQENGGDLGSPPAKLVYDALLVSEKVTATELQELLGLSKLTLLAVLTSLVQKALVFRTERGYASQ